MSTVRDRKFARNPSRTSLRNEQQHPAISAGETHQLEVAVGSGSRDARDPGGEDRGGRRIGGDHQMAGRAEDGEHRHRQQHRVQPGDDGHPGDAGVAEGLGIPSAASVRPASSSAGSCRREIGSTADRIGNAPGRCEPDPGILAAPHC